MKAVGLIAEYNPFHNGHLYQINKIKEMFPNYPIIVVMSGNFTERGDISLIDKWKKTNICLNNGIDLVIELPFPFATQSADIFAHGAISILKELQVSDIIFGSESDNKEILIKNANIQLNNNKFDELTKLYLKDGISYPNALNKALVELGGTTITEPNDLLGLSYIKEIIKQNASINVATIKRTNDFNSKTIDSTITSAMSIRKALDNNIDINPFIPNDASIYNNYHKKEDYFSLLRYQILSNLDDLEKFNGIDQYLANSIKDNILKVNSFDELITLIKAKNYTYMRISRTLTHILCSYTKEKNNIFKEIEYIRILGFNNIGKEYLNKIKKDVTLPIISRFGSSNNKMLQYELQITGIYYNNDIDKNNKTMEEYKHIPIYKEN